VKKQIKILDHRLEKALAKHNHTLASNKRLREGIDNMRRERIVFAQVRFTRRAGHRWRLLCRRFVRRLLAAAWVWVCSPKQQTLLASIAAARLLLPCRNGARLCAYSLCAAAAEK
jgi:hypothetical protein